MNHVVYIYWYIHGSVNSPPKSVAESGVRRGGWEPGQSQWQKCLPEPMATTEVRDRYGTGTEQVGTGTGQVRDRFGKGTGQVRDRYGTGTGQVRDRYGTGTGQVRNRYGTGTEQVYGYLSRRCTRSPVHLRKQLKDTCRYLFRTSSVPDPYNTEQPKQSHIESKSRQKRPEKRGMNGYQVITSKQSLCFDTAFHPIKATPNTSYKSRF